MAVAAATNDNGQAVLRDFPARRRVVCCAVGVLWAMRVLCRGCHVRCVWFVCVCVCGVGLSLSLSLSLSLWALLLCVACF